MNFSSAYAWLSNKYQAFLVNENLKRTRTVMKWTFIAAIAVIVCGFCTAFICVDPFLFTVLALFYVVPCTVFAVVWRTREVESLGYSWSSPLQSMRNFYENHKEGLCFFGFTITTAGVFAVTRNIYLTAIIMAGVSGGVAVFALREDHKGILAGVSASTGFLLFLAVNGFIPFGFLGFFILTPAVIFISYNAGFQLEGIISDVVELIRDISKGSQEQPQLQPALNQLEQPQEEQKLQKAEEAKDLKKSEELVKPNTVNAQANDVIQAVKFN
jgi:hypothetical protein